MEWRGFDSMRILIILILVLVLYYMLRGLFRPRKGERVGRSHPNVGEGTDNELVKDPYCLVYVPVNTAFHTKREGKDLFFCSKECMNRYLQERKDNSSDAG